MISKSIYRNTLAGRIGHHDLGPVRVVTAGFFAPTALWPILGSMPVVAAASAKLQGIAAGVTGTPDSELTVRAVAELFERIACLADLQPEQQGTSPAAGERLLEHTGVAIDGTAKPVSSQLLYQFDRHGRVSPEIGARSTNGVAVHDTFDSAAANALLEVLERDAVLRWWDGDLEGAARPLFDVELDDDTLELRRALQGWGVSLSLIKIRRLEKFWVCICVLKYPNLRRRNVVGSASGVNLNQTARKAVIEGVVLMESLRGTQTPQPAQVQAALLSSHEFDRDFEARSNPHAAHTPATAATQPETVDVRKVFAAARVEGVLAPLNEAAMTAVGLVAVRAIVPAFRVPRFDLQWAGDGVDSRSLFDAGRLMPIG